MQTRAQLDAVIPLVHGTVSMLRGSTRALREVASGDVPADPLVRAALRAGVVDTLSGLESLMRTLEAVREKLGSSDRVAAPTRGVVQRRAARGHAGGGRHGAAASSVLPSAACRAAASPSPTPPAGSSTGSPPTTGGGPATHRRSSSGSSRSQAGRAARIADLGAGTGHLALPLARAGGLVHAVEPARAMLDVLSADSGGLEVVPVHAAAEETGLAAGGFDLVVLADALHWVDPERGGREVARLLAPEGRLAVVVPALADTPFLRALAELLARANPKARPGPPPVTRLFAAAGLTAPVEERFVDEVPLDEDGLDAVLRSLSYAGPALGPAALARLLADARAVARQHGGAVWRRDLALHLSPAP